MHRKSSLEWKADRQPGIEEKSGESRRKSCFFLRSRCIIRLSYGQEKGEGFFRPEQPGKLHS